MPDFSAYDSCDTQSVSAITSGIGPTQPAGGGPAHYLHKALKRKRSESTDDSDDPADKGYNYHHTRHPPFGRQYPVAESGYGPAKPDDERGHAAKRARLADDFAELRLRGQSLSPTSGINPAPVPLWAPAPVVEERESASPHLPQPPAPIPLDIDITPPGILRGEVEEVVSPGVQAERSRGETIAYGNERDVKMHGTSSYEPERDRTSLRSALPLGVHADGAITVHRDYNNRPRRLRRLGRRVFHHPAVHIDIDTVQNLKCVPVTVWEHPPSRV